MPPPPMVRLPWLTPPTNVCCAVAVAPLITVTLGDVVSIVTVSVAFGTADVFQWPAVNQLFDTVPTQTGLPACAGASATPVSAVEPISNAIREAARDARQPRTRARPKPASRLNERRGPFGMHDP